MNHRRQNDDDADRVAILSVPAKRIRPHFWTFSICFVATLIFYIFVHVVIAENPSWEKTPSAVMGDTTRAAGFWLFASPILVEGAAMVFAAMFRQKNREEGREEGIAQGRKEGFAQGREEGIAQGHEAGREEGSAETNAAWREWNRRRLDAEARGELFSEPTPDPRNGSGGDGN